MAGTIAAVAFANDCFSIGLLVHPLPSYRSPRVPYVIEANISARSREKSGFFPILQRVIQCLSLAGGLEVQGEKTNERGCVAAELRVKIQYSKDRNRANSCIIHHSSKISETLRNHQQNRPPCVSQFLDVHAVVINEEDRSPTNLCHSLALKQSPTLSS